MAMDEQLSWFEARLLSPSYWRVLLTAAVLGLVLLALLWLAQRPFFDLRRVMVSGDVARVNLRAVKNQTLADIGGNFWGVNLLRLQTHFEQVPWVRRAIVHRQFPDTVRIQIEEQVPAAFWQNDSGNAFVNGFGEVFEADASDLADDLPVFKGQESQSGRMMNMYVALQREFATYGVQIREIGLSDGGGWRVLLNTGGSLELGRGSDRELQARLQQFFPALLEILPSKSIREALLMIASADLRYQNGFSVRLRSGVDGERVE